MENTENMNFYLQDGLRLEFIHSLLMRTYSTGNVDIIY